MKMIFEEYGDLILQIIGALAVFGLILFLLREGGALRDLISQLIESAC